MESKPQGGWAARLERVLERQLQLYAQLDALSAKQSNLIDTERTDELIDLLRRRQGLIDQVAELNTQMQPYREQWEQLADSLDTDKREALREKFDDLSAAVRRIVMRDDADRVRLEARRARIARDLAGVSSGQGAVNAYASKGAPPAPRLQDRSA